MSMCDVLPTTGAIAPTDYVKESSSVNQSHPSSDTSFDWCKLNFQLERPYATSDEYMSENDDQNTRMHDCDTLDATDTAMEPDGNLTLKECIRRLPKDLPDDVRSFFMKWESSGESSKQMVTDDGRSNLPPISLRSVPSPASSTSTPSTTLTPIKRKLTHAHYSLPFRWENHVDDGRPFGFHLIRSTVDHPSCAVGSAADAENYLFGCSCPNGECGADCECSRDAQAQYTLDGKIKEQKGNVHANTKSEKKQRYRECWEKCSCACREDATTTLSMSTNSTVPSLPTASKKRGRPRQTARFFNASQPSSAPPPIMRNRCFNRVVGRGSTGVGMQFMVFQTLDGRGWGLKTLVPIERGAYVIDYVGERIHEHVTEARARRNQRMNIMNYIFTPEKLPEDEIERDERPSKRQKCDDDDEEDDNSSSASHEDSSDSDSDSDLQDIDDAKPDEERVANMHNEPYSIDARCMGNLARFINTDCQPNLTLVEVLIERRDPRYVHGALFAKKNIPPNTELTFDYKQIDFICVCGTCVKKRQVEAEHRSPRSPDGASKKLSIMRTTPTSPHTKQLIIDEQFLCEPSPSPSSSPPAMRSLDVELGVPNRSSISPPVARPSSSFIESDSDFDSNGGTNATRKVISKGKSGEWRHIFTADTTVRLTCQPIEISYRQWTIKCAFDESTNLITHVVARDLFAPLGIHKHAASNGLTPYALGTSKNHLLIPGSSVPLLALNANGMKAWMAKRTWKSPDQLAYENVLQEQIMSRLQ